MDIDKLENLIIDAQPGFACSKVFQTTEKEGVAHLRPNNVGYWGGLNLEHIVYIQRDKVDEKKRGLKKGDVLFNNTNSKELVGRPVLIEHDLDAAFSNHITKIQVKKEKIHSPWLVWYLYQLWLEGYFLRICRKWIGQAGVDTSMLKAVEVSYPGIKEQELAVEKIQQLFKKANGGTEKLEYCLTELENLLPSSIDYFLENLPKNYRLVPVSEVCDVKIGGTPRRGVGKFWLNGTEPWVSVAELNGNIITDTKEKITVEGVKNSNTKLIPKGTVLLSFKLSVGKVAIAGIDLYTNEAIAAFIPKDKVFAEYLYYILPYFAKHAATRGSLGKNLNSAKIRSLEIPMPFKVDEFDLTEQKKMTARFAKISNQSKNLERLFNQELSLLKQIKQSILKKALVGELVKVKQEEPKIFPIQQAIGFLIQSFERGEMIIAKMLYMAQEIFKAPLGIQFTPQNFGPYDAVVKRAITSGVSPRNQFFTKKRAGGQEVFAPGAKINNLMKYNYRSTQQVRNFLSDMSSLLQSADSPAIERLATVCKIVQDNKTTDETIVKTKMQEWKPGKFQDQDVVRSLNFIKTKGWDKILTQ